MLRYFTDRPMLLCGIFCSFTAVLGYYFRFSLLIFGGAVSAALAVMFIKRVRPALIFSVAVALAAIFSSIFTCGRIDRISELGGKSVSSEFIVCNITYRGDGYVISDIELKSNDKILNGVKASVFSRLTSLKMGELYSADIKFSEIKSDYRLASFAKGIYIGGSLTEPVKLDGKCDFVLTAVEKTRKYIEKTVFSAMGRDEAATLCALLFGDRSRFSDEFYSNVKAAGVSHVMVVSGMHLSILVNMLTGITERLFYNRHIKAIIMLVTVLILTAVCGFTMSILRAGVMYALAAVGLLLGRKGVTENTLGAATSLIIVASPFSIFNVAFQLSLLSTLGITAVAVPLNTRLSLSRRIKSRALKYILSSFTVTVCAMLLTLPVSVYTFGYTSYIAPIANLLIAPFVTYALCFAVAALSVGLIWGMAADLLFVPCESFLKYINFVINKTGAPNFTVNTPVFYTIPAILLIILIFWLLLTCKRKQNMLKSDSKKNKIIREGGKKLKWQ